MNIQRIAVWVVQELKWIVIVTEGWPGSQRTVNINIVRVRESSKVKSDTMNQIKLWIVRLVT